MGAPLHVTNGDAVVREIAEAAEIDRADVLPWRDVLHDGPVPAGADPGELARIRAGHLAARGWIEEGRALEDILARDARLAKHPGDAEVVLWFEDDLYDALQLAQISDRLVGRAGPVSLVRLPHPPRGDLRAALRDREPMPPDREPFAVLRSPDPRAWQDIPSFGRLLEELPDRRDGLSRLEREILEALREGPLDQRALYRAVAPLEQPPWLGDWSLWALADELVPLVERRREREREPYALTGEGRAVLAGERRRSVPDRWLGGVRLGPGLTDWVWDPGARAAVVRGGPA